MNKTSINDYKDTTMRFFSILKCCCPSDATSKKDKKELLLKEATGYIKQEVNSIPFRSTAPDSPNSSASNDSVSRENAYALSGSPIFLSPAQAIPCSAPALSLLHDEEAPFRAFSSSVK